MTQSGWPTRVAHVVAGEVRRYRKEHHLSAQQVADRCADLGMEISRSTIADLENGRRATVSVAELLMLAAVLGVPPVLLVAPLGRQPTVEALPGRDAETWQVVQWVSGRSGKPDPPDPPAPPIGFVPLYEQHHTILRELVTGAWRAEALQDDPDALRQHYELRGIQERTLAAVRSRMRFLDLMPPKLPPELAHLDKPGEAAVWTE